MSQANSHESKPDSAAPESEQAGSVNSATNGVTVESADGIEAEAMERLAEESFDASEQEVDIRSTDPPSPSPVVEILPPEAIGIDPERFANMAVNRTQISLGLTGISFNRTRLSGASGQPADDQTSGNSGRGQPR